MNAIEVVLADGSEDRIFSNDKREQVAFLRKYKNRKSATVRFNPGGALMEFFDTTRKTAATQAIQQIESVGI
jgi:hypothetical protein